MSLTLKEFAKQIGYSPSTISKALNDSKSCYTSESVKESIRKKAAELGYRPNLTARSLITQRTNTIGLLLPSIGGFYAELVRLMEFALEERKYFGLFAFWRPEDGDAGFRNAYERIVQRGIDGIITCHYTKWLKDCHMPLVVYGNKHDDIDCVFPDKFDYGRRAVDFLRKLGHRKIAFVGRREDLRFKSYRAELDANGLPFREEWACDCGLSLTAAEAAAEKISESADIPSAVLAFNDMTAYAVIHTFMKNGIRVPEDISVIGFDDLPEAKYYNPPLTTFQHDISNVAELLVDVILKRIETPDFPLQAIPLCPDIVERASAGPCAERKRR